MSIHAELIVKMTEYERGQPHRAAHFVKVYGYTKVIGALSGLDLRVRFMAETAAIVHDIGIKPALQQYGSSAGHYQEQLGGPAAREMLSSLGFEQDVTDRVCFLVAHHHTYSGVDGLDWQILLEADFLVNGYEEEMSRDAIYAAYGKVFKTEAGKCLCREMYLSQRHS